MKGKILSVMLVVVLLLSVSITPARADTPLPQGLNGEEPDLGNSSLMPDDYVPPDDLIQMDITAPYPLSPTGYLFTFNRTPKLYFARNELATAYKIYMYDVREDSILVYTFVGGTENCGTAYCWLKPPNRLKTWKYDETSGGYYRWRVSAKIDGSWVHNANYGYFYVRSKGFTSTFDVNTNGWEEINGTWKRTPAGQYKTNGILGTNVSAWNKDKFVENMVLEVRMKRKVETGSSSGILFFGYPYPLWGTTNRWYDCYNFMYYNNHDWSLYKYIDGVSTYMTSGWTSYDEPLDWNTFKFWLHDGKIYIWVNGIYVAVVSDTSLSGGAVGLAMYESDSALSPLLVDYVKVYYSGVFPDEIPQEEIVLKAPEFELSPGGDYIIQ